MVKKILELKNVTKVYKLGNSLIYALKNISFSLNEQEFVSVIGPSGSGKSTLLNLIGALDTPTEGEIILDGIKLSELSENQLTKIRRYKIGFIFQFFNLIPVLTAYENIDLPLMAAGIKKSERKKRVIDLLRIVGLEDRKDHLPEELSGGEQQRVAIARALANNPTIILADEPTGNLDSATGMEIIKYLKSLKKTTIIVTHDPEVAQMTEKIIHLKDGLINKIEVNK